MTATAYDVKEEGPLRSQIDPFRTIDALREGYEICFRSGFTEAELRAKPTQIVWALIVEATRTERAMQAPRAKGFGNGWPEVVRSQAEEFAARASRLESGLPEYEIVPRSPRPTAAQISRWDEVMVWLRFCHAVDKLQARDVLWLKAMGAPWPALQEQTGLSIKRLKNMKAEQLRHIMARLRQELKKYNWEDAVFS